MKVDYEKNSDGVGVDHEKKSDGVRVDHEKNSNGDERSPRERERWGESSA